MKTHFHNLFNSKVFCPALFLALALLGLLLLGNLTGLLDRSQPAWVEPIAPTVTIQASPTPGWWSDLPTPAPVNKPGKPELGEMP
jgi:hypothetical protein